MHGRLRHYWRRLHELPPRVIAQRAGARLRTLADRWRRFARDLCCATYSDAFCTGPLTSLIQSIDKAELRESVVPFERLAELYCAHKFDLLGSDWVHVFHGMQCVGLEGHCYPPATSGRVQPATIVRRLNRANRRSARVVWALVDADYEPIDWQIDFKSGYRWSEAVWYRHVRYGHAPGADVKVPWELARMQHLVHLAWAACLAGTHADDRAGACVKEFRNQVLDFIGSNPPRFGVNWSCTMDVAIRVANWLMAYDLFRAQGIRFDEPFDRVFGRSVYEHARHIATNLEWNEELRGNHYLADIVGLLFAVSYLPRSSETEDWKALALRELEREVASQFAEEGSSFEGSTSYHRLSAEMVSYAAALALGLQQRATGNAPDPTILFPPWFWQRLERMGEFIIDTCKPDGLSPQIGDNDNGRFFKVEPALAMRRTGRRSPALAEEQRDQRHVLAALAGLFGRSQFWRFAQPYRLDRLVIEKLSGGARIPRGSSARLKRRLDSATSCRTVIRELEARAAAVPAPLSLQWEYPWRVDVAAAGWSVYREFGLYVFRHGSVYLAIRCGSVGQKGFGGHAHNDQLEIELSVDGNDVLVDPGTYVYTSLPARRNEYRSVAAHNAPQLQGIEPGELDRGLFLLGSAGQGTCLCIGRDVFAGKYDSPMGAIYRIVRLRQTGLHVTDFAELNDAGRRANSLRLLSFGNRVPRYSPGYGLRDTDDARYPVMRDLRSVN